MWAIDCIDARVNRYEKDLQAQSHFYCADDSSLSSSTAAERSCWRLCCCDFKCSFFLWTFSHSQLPCVLSIPVHLSPAQYFIKTGSYFWYLAPYSVYCCLPPLNLLSQISIAFSLYILKLYCQKIGYIQATHPIQHLTYSPMLFPLSSRGKTG